MVTSYMKNRHDKYLLKSDVGRAQPTKLASPTDA